MARCLSQFILWEINFHPERTLNFQKIYLKNFSFIFCLMFFSHNVLATQSAYTHCTYRLVTYKRRGTHHENDLCLY